MFEGNIFWEYPEVAAKVYKHASAKIKGALLSTISNSFQLHMECVLLSHRQVKNGNVPLPWNSLHAMSIDCWPKWFQDICTLFIFWIIKLFFRILKKKVASTFSQFSRVADGRKKNPWHRFVEILNCGSIKKNPSKQNERDFWSSWKITYINFSLEKVRLENCF